MRIYRFNPEHEIALAHGRANFTPPHAATRLRQGLGWMPALWAEDGDIVIVDDVDYARKAARKWRGTVADVHYMTFEDLKKMLRELDINNIKVQPCPWGWDLPVRSSLMRSGISARLLPTLSEMDDIRQLAHRKTSIVILHKMTDALPVTIGERHAMHSIEEVAAYMSRHGSIVLKSPWSSSGRGVRYLSDSISYSEERWIDGVIARQGCIIAEPRYIRILDFALEMEMTCQGAKYLGLSLFGTAGGAYTGNLLSTEERKRERLSKFISQEFLDKLIETSVKVLTDELAGRYKGLFGIDMMVVAAGEGYLVHPCVEVNLRQTMGHVALSLSPTPLEPDAVMYISHGVNDELKVEVEREFVKVV